MIQHTVPRTCMSCGKVIKGRSDKKFCDDFCRNSFNNDLKSDSNNYVRNINNALRKNRRILEDYLAAGHEMVKITKDKMLQQGFQFKYSTHTYTNNKGNIYYFCYDYGYLALENGWYLVVKNSKP